MALMLLTAPLVPSIATPSVIFADCDGTMLGPDHRLSKKTRQSLQALSEAGIAVVPATGRAKAGPWTSHVLSEPALKGGAPGIYMNGGMTVDEEGLVSCSLLSASAAATTLDFAADAPVTAMVYSGDQALVDSSNHLISRLSEVGDAPIHKVDALEGALHNTAKILLLFDEDDVDAKELRTSLEHHVGEIAGVTQALSWALEVVPFGVNKAVAAKALLDRWGIAPQNAAAIGDGANDVDLLELVGMGIAMGNGGGEIQRVAKHVAPSNADEGFSWAMNELILS